jgi:hypothetical protein
MSEGNWSEKNATTLVAKSAYNAVVAQNKRYRGALEHIYDARKYLGITYSKDLVEEMAEIAQAALKDKE